MSRIPRTAARAPIVAALTALVASFALVAVAVAQAPSGSRGVQLLSHAPGGGSANEAVVSQDKRTARYMAYVSTASDIVGGTRNVYVAIRDQPLGTNGTPWVLGNTILASKATSGAANGDSFGVSINGDDQAGASCVAFVSNASNLVGGDGNGHADAFVRNLPSGGLHRIPAGGAISEVNVDRRCEHLYYTTSSGVFRVSLTGGGAAKGRAHRVVGGGGISGFQVDDNARAAVFTRGGDVFCSNSGSGFKSLGNGSSPAISGSGKYEAFERGGTIFGAHLCGGVNAVHAGSQPQLTLAGHYILYVDGNSIWTTNIKHVLATCSGPPKGPVPSGHGNYVSFVCDDPAGTPQAYLLYIGPQ